MGEKAIRTQTEKMNNQDKWIEVAIEIQSIAQAGLTYGKDIYDLERLRRKVASFQDYSINTGLSSEWKNIINDLLYRRSHR